ncbi:MAG: hypothetical protein JW810_01225 [Sedimentisphaerales bacterium]|nr:hypothetical protein [Sedimentisphaerales bacterium]
MVPDQARGSRVRCYNCGQLLLVPAVKKETWKPKPSDPELVSAESSPEAKDKKKK